MGATESVGEEGAAAAAVAAGGATEAAATVGLGCRLYLLLVAVGRAAVENTHPLSAPVVGGSDVAARPASKFQEGGARARVCCRGVMHDARAAMGLAALAAMAVQWRAARSRIMAAGEGAGQGRGRGRVARRLARRTRNRLGFFKSSQQNNQQPDESS